MTSSLSDKWPTAASVRYTEIVRKKRVHWRLKNKNTLEAISTSQQQMSSQEKPNFNSNSYVFFLASFQQNFKCNQWKSFRKFLWPKLPEANLIKRCLTKERICKAFNYNAESTMTAGQSKLHIPLCKVAWHKLAGYVKVSGKSVRYY